MEVGVGTCLFEGQFLLGFEKLIFGCGFGCENTVLEGDFLLLIFIIIIYIYKY